MKNWWRKWSYEIPLAFGDALWEVLVVQFAAFLSRLTLRRVLEFVAIAILAIAFAQTFPIDLAILFAGDTLMYLEIVVIIRLIAGREHLQHAVRVAAHLIRLAIRALRAAVTPAGGADQPAARAALPCPSTASRSLRRWVGFWCEVGRSGRGMTTRSVRSRRAGAPPVRRLPSSSLPICGFRAPPTAASMLERVSPMSRNSRSSRSIRTLIAARRPQ